MEVKYTIIYFKNNTLLLGVWGRTLEMGNATWISKYFDVQSNISSNYLKEIYSLIYNNNLYSSIKNGNYTTPKSEFRSYAVNLLSELGISNTDLLLEENSKLDEVELSDYLFTNRTNEKKWYIQQMEFLNYRQFLGNVELDLDYIYGKNVNVIMGATGHGKTTILYALSWVLYGEEIFLKDPEKIEERLLINKKLIQESQNDTETVKVIVKIIKDNTTWILSRGLTYNRGINNKFSPSRSSTLTIQTFNGTKMKEIPKDEHGDQINLLLPKDIYRYFISDGERVKSLLQSENNENSIAALIDLNTLNYISKVLETAISTLRKEGAKDTKKKIRINNLQNEISQLEKEIEKVEKELISFNDELIKTKEEREDVNNQLMEFSDVNLTKLQKRKDDLTLKNKRLKEEQKEILSSLRKEEILSYPEYVILDEIEQIIKDAEPEPNNNEVHLTDIQIAQILESMKCVCNREINENIVSIIKAKGRKGENKVFLKTDKDNYLKIITQIKNDRVPINYTESDLKYDKKQDEINENNLEIARITKLLMGSDSKKFKELYRKRDELDKEIDDLKYKIENRKKMHKELIQSKKEKSHELEELQKTIDVNRQTTIKVNNLTFIRSEFIKLMRNIKESLRELLEKKIFDYTKQLFQQSPFDRLELSEKYVVRVFYNSINVMGDLSEGQRQLLGYCYTMALSSMSGFDAPIMIDFPLGRLDTKYQKLISDLVPNILPTTQLTFLLTTAEYTPEVKEILDKVTIRSWVLKTTGDPPRSYISLPKGGNPP